MQDMKQLYNIVFSELPKLMAKYFEKAVSSCDENWWIKFVYNKLSYAQQNHIKKSGINSLHELDIAALLRIFDKNWDFLESQNKDLTRRKYIYLKKIMETRNDLAHPSSEGISREIISHSFNSLRLFVQSLEPDCALSNRLQSIIDSSQSLTTKPLASPDIQQNKTKQKINVEKLKSGEFWSGKTKTTQIGYINGNQQQVAGTRGVPSKTHENQLSYKVKCLRQSNGDVCGEIYGANGCDLHLRKCPKCQNGQPPMDY